MIALHTLYVYVAAVIGAASIVIGLLVFLMMQNPLFLLIGAAVLWSIPFIENKWKRSLNRKIAMAVNESVTFQGLFAKSGKSLGGHGYLAVTKNFLVFVKQGDVYSYELGDISSYIVGQKSTNNFVLGDNVRLQGGKRTVEIILQNGDHMTWQFSSSNWSTSTFEKSLIHRLGLTMNPYSIPIPVESSPTLQPTRQIQR